MKYLPKYWNYPLTTTLGDRFASCENIVSWSQTSSLPPPPRPTPDLLYSDRFHKESVAVWEVEHVRDGVDAIGKDLTIQDARN